MLERLDKTDNLINGVVIYEDTDTRGCWCIKGMTGRDEETEYKSCFIEDGGKSPISVV